MSGGYIGKLLFVDLSEGKLKDEALDEKFCRDFIGGYGIGARILFSRQRAGADPLGADNILGMVTGPLTGTPALSGSRYTVVGKSPLTGGWGDSNSGGEFGPQLKFAGYDGIFFTGMSTKPVYLYINSGQAELRDATHLWGKDTAETEDVLRAEVADDLHVASIGPSGEKLCLIAAIINNKGRAAGRSGLGAVMGSKKIKAVVVRGNMGIPLADETGAKQLRKELLGKLKGPLVDYFRSVGTPGDTEGAARSGDSPIKNWGGIGALDFPDVAPIAGDQVIERVSKKYGCFRCPLACGGLMKAGTGEYKYEAGVHKTEYETLSAFGMLCLNNNLESIIKVNDICNRYGLDTISTGCTIAFAIECYEQGIITEKDTEGIELRWGNHKAIVTMTEKLAKRNGFGDVLADGVKVAVDKIGKGAEQYAIHVGGQEVPMHDPKFRAFYALSYRLDATPARHTQGVYGMPLKGVPMPAFDPKSFSGRAEAYKKFMMMGHIVNCIGICQFMYATLYYDPIDGMLSRNSSILQLVGM